MNDNKLLNMKQVLYNKNKITYFQWLLLVIFLVISLISLLKFRQDVLVWPATADIIPSLKLSDPLLYENDFYASSAIKSITYYYYYLINILAKTFHFEIELVFTIFGVFICTFYYSILYIYFVTNSKLRIKKNSIAEICIYSVILFILFLLFRNKELMGWRINLTPHGYVVSFTLVTFAMFCQKFNRNYLLRGISIILCILACICHPIIAAYSLFIFTFLNFNFSNIIDEIKRYFILYICTVITILICYICIKVNDNFHLSAEEFINIYIYQRHPHHYLLSIINKSLFCSSMIAFAFCSYILKRLKDDNWVNCLFFTIFYIFVFVFHYVGTEIYKIKLIAILHLPRFFQFFFIILSYYCSIVVFLLFKNMWKIIHNKEILKKMFVWMNIIYHSSSTVINYGNLLKILTKILVFVLLIVLTVRFYHSYSRQYENYKNLEVATLSQYKNALSLISRDDVIAIFGSDPFVFSLRTKYSVYSSNAFVFLESKMEEFTERNRLFNDCQYMLSVSCANKMKKYKLDYLLVNKQNYKSNKISLDLKKYKVYEDSNVLLYNIKILHNL